MTAGQLTKQNNNGIVQAETVKELKLTTQALNGVKRLMESGRLHLPSDYSPENAIKSAELMFATIVNREDKPIFVGGRIDTNLVSQESVVNALMDMVTQGLNPAKKQGYFIVYGKALVWQRSYFGEMALAERIMPGINFYMDVIHDGEKFLMGKSYTSNGFVTLIKDHEISFPRSGEVIGAYCGAFDQHGNNLGCDVFDMDRIKKSWGMSKMKPVGNDGTVSPTSTHAKFTAEMAVRTMVRHYCKPIINASSDVLLMESVKRSRVEEVEGEVADDVEMYANQDVIDVSHAGRYEDPPARPNEQQAIPPPQSQATPEDF